MKLKTLLTASSLALAASFPAMAEIYTNEQGQRVECHDEEVTTKKGVNPTVGTLAGAAIGGVVGNQFGSGKGKTAMTAAGAAGGAMAGKNYSENNAPEKQLQRVCRPVSE